MIGDSPPHRPPDEVPQAAVYRVRLLATTDVHGNLLPHDYYTDRPDITVGLSRTASLIAEARSEVPNCLLFDCGDFLQGTPLADFAAEAGPDAPNPVVSAMNLLRYDAAALGNHDFNHGLAVLNGAVSQADFPMLCANVSAEGLSVPGTALLELHLHPEPEQEAPPATLRVGVFGVTPPQVMHWDRHHLGDRARARDMVETAAECIAQLRQAGADLVIGLCHTGIGPVDAAPGMEDAAVPIAALDGIDVILTGHTHNVFPGPRSAGTGAAAPAAGPIDPVAGTLHGKPAVMAGCWGARLGLVDLTLRRRDGRWSCAGFRTETRAIHLRDQTTGAPIATVADEPGLAAHLAPIHAATRRKIRLPVCRSPVPLHTYFAQVGPSRAMDILAEAQASYLAQRLEGTEAEGLPVLSAVAPFKAGGRAGPGFYTNVPAGDLLRRHVADLYLYPNAFCAMRTTGAELRRWLDLAASQFRQVVPGAGPVPLLDPDFPSHSFDILCGATYEIDLGVAPRFAADGREIRPGTSRIRALRHGGADIADDMEFVVAANGYRAGGGGGFPIWPSARLICQSADTNRDILFEHLRTQGVADVPPQRVFTFSPQPGAEILFATGHGAADHAEEAASLGLEPEGRTDEGFLLYRLTL